MRRSGGAGLGFWTGGDVAVSYAILLLLCREVVSSHVGMLATRGLQAIVSTVTTTHRQRSPK